MKPNYYAALLRADGSEPSHDSGYARSYIGEVDIFDLPVVATQNDHIFPDVPAPGWGEIVSYAVYDAPTDGNLMLVFGLPKPVNCHAGTIPVIHNGRLLLGVDMSAEIKLCAVTTAEAKKG